MNSKEEKVKNIKNTKKKNGIKITLKKIIMLLTCIISILYIYVFYNFYFASETVFARKSIEEFNTNIEISNINKISTEKFTLDAEKLNSENSNQNYKEELIEEEKVLEYTTKYINSSKIPKGTIQVIQEGREGIEKAIIKKSYENNELINEEQISSKMIKAPLNKIVEIGTNNNIGIYKFKVGDIVYPTSDRLELKLKPDNSSEKITVLGKEQKLKIKEILDNWFEVNWNNKIGYVKKESVTIKIDQNSGKSNIEKNETKQENKSVNTNISFNIDLRKPTGLSLEQFRKVLKDNKDTNNVLEKNAEYFYYIEKQYNINGLFVAALAIHESNWGTSQIAKDKNNLFGYGAYDKNPYNSAYDFSACSEGIDLVSRVFIKYYLNPKGTKIYNGEIAEGTYYNGSTLTAINIKYATDKNWSNAVYNHMKYLYNKL